MGLPLFIVREEPQSLPFTDGLAASFHSENQAPHPHSNHPTPSRVPVRQVLETTREMPGRRARPRRPLLRQSSPFGHMRRSLEELREEILREHQQQIARILHTEAELYREVLESRVEVIEGRSQLLQYLHLQCRAIQRQRANERILLDDQAQSRRLLSTAAAMTLLDPRNPFVRIFAMIMVDNLDEIGGMPSCLEFRDIGMGQQIPVGVLQEVLPEETDEYSNLGFLQRNETPLHGQYLLFVVDAICRNAPHGSVLFSRDALYSAAPDSVSFKRFVQRVEHAVTELHVNRITLRFTLAENAFMTSFEVYIESHGREVQDLWRRLFIVVRAASETVHDERF